MSVCVDYVYKRKYARVREELDHLRPQFSLEQLWSKLHLLRLPCLHTLLGKVGVFACDVRLQVRNLLWSGAKGGCIFKPMVYSDQLSVFNNFYAKVQRISVQIHCKNKSTVSHP